MSAIWSVSIVACMVFHGILSWPATLQAQTITGTVQTAGKPVVGATVRLLELDRIEHTGAQGQFTFSDVPKGTYRVYVGVTGYASVTDTVKVMSDIARISIDLRESAIHLKEVNAAPIAGRQVHLGWQHIAERRTEGSDIGEKWSCGSFRLPLEQSIHEGCCPGKCEREFQKRASGTVGWNHGENSPSG